MSETLNGEDGRHTDTRIHRIIDKRRDERAEMRRTGSLTEFFFIKKPDAIKLLFFLKKLINDS